MLNGSMTVARFAGRLAYRAHRVDRQLALADRVGADRLQDGERLAHGRRPDPVGLERLAQRLHRRRRELAQLEVPDARQQVAVPDLRVGGEGVAGQPPARVVRPPVILDELAEDDAAATQLVQRSSAPREAQVGLVVDGVVDCVELLASPLAADRIRPAHAERPDRAPRVPARLDATRDLGLGRPLDSSHAHVLADAQRSREPLPAPTAARGHGRRPEPPRPAGPVRRVERRANHSSIASGRILSAP